MGLRDWRSHWNRAIEDESLKPDLGRSLRSIISVILPLALAVTGHLPLETPFVVIAAHSIAMIDVRGAYSVRFGFLLAMVLLLAGTTLLGTLASHHPWTALLATALVALNSGLWRHLTPEYGPALATPAGLLFFVALLSPPTGDHALAALAGAIWGLIVQVAMWPIRHEHPLRRSVAESWLSAGELFNSCSPPPSPSEISNLKSSSPLIPSPGTPCPERSRRAGEGQGEGSAQHPFNPQTLPTPTDRHTRIFNHETKLRGTLDQGYQVLEGARGHRPIIPRLQRLHTAAARLATDVSALNTSLEPLRNLPGVNQAWQSAAESLANTARAIALAVVSRQPAHLAVAEVRLRRASTLLQSLRTRLGSDPVTGGIIAQVESQLAESGQALRATVSRAAERAIFPLELLELNTWRLRPMTAVLNLSTRPDPAIVRYTLRSAAVTMIAILAAQAWRLPHAYWLPYTVLVVMQADYGATRLRAVQRLTGTLLGSLLGSALLMLHLPLGVIVAAVGVTAMLFAFFFRRNYAIAVIFITLFVVLLTEARQPVTIALTLERLGSTAAGGALALAAALLFWPTWERNRLPALLAKSIRANQKYLTILVHQLEHGTGNRSTRIEEKRSAERANREVFNSLERLFADPQNRREGAERLAVLANGNQRLTRSLNLLSVTLDTTPSKPQPDDLTYAHQLMQTLSELASTIEHGETLPTRPPIPLPPSQHPDWISIHLLRAATELSAMQAALSEPPP